MNNKVFYQHPNLMRALGMHETVMEVMVNVLGGGGDSKVTLIIFYLFSLSILFSLTSLCEGPVGHFHCLSVHRTAHSRQNVSFHFFSSGDSIPPNGDQLLSFPVLLLSHQPTEPALHVWPSELPATEQRHRLGLVSATCHTVCCTVHRATFYLNSGFICIFECLKRCKDQILNFPSSSEDLWHFSPGKIKIEISLKTDLLILHLQACVGPRLWMWLRLLASTTMSWRWLYRSRTWKWFEKIKKKWQERKTHERL